MKTIELTTAVKSVAEYAAAIGDEPGGLIDNSQRVAALGSLKHVDKDPLARSPNDEIMDIIKEARCAIATGRVLSFDERRRAVLP